jgi:CRISPR-associated protein Cmr6
MIRGLDKWAAQKGIETPKTPENLPERKVLKKALNTTKSPSLQEPPMMYRAQIQGRCNLQFAGENADLDEWKQQWLHLKNTYNLERVNTEDNIHLIKIKFPYRVLSNSGQDSILRPMLNVYGIPFIPGSSVKGVFKRLAQSQREYQQDITTYCGDTEQAGKLRFHGAYPIGDWSDRMIDIVHPQMERQVKGNKVTSAFSLISFFEPTFVFEFSSADSEINWERVEEIFRQALKLGLGGKTSTGYGFATTPNPTENTIRLALKGEGVSSLLLNSTPEFRPNMFKASLRGHVLRLLGGVCHSDSAVEKHADRLFGSTDAEGVIRLFWESSKLSFNENTRPSSYYTQGSLHLSTTTSEDLDFITKVLQFAYTMGGFGKSWRRVWHGEFKRDYRKFAIGCHWQTSAYPSEWSQINSAEELQKFLQDLYTVCQGRLVSTQNNQNYVAAWREVWHPQRVKVFCSKKPVTRSEVINLFHTEPYKITLEISGKTRINSAPKAVSHVWHRMLPIEGGKYLEIVTIFYNLTNQDKFQEFIAKIQSLGLSEIHLLPNNTLG